MVLYEALTGSLPFQASTAVDLARLHMEAEPPRLTEMVPDTSPALEQILIKVLSKEPSQRYRTADQLGRVLMNFGNARSAPVLTLTPESDLLRTPAHTTAPEPLPNAEIDWPSVGLGLVALVAVLGLIPFWIWIYFVYNPPLH